MIQRDYGHIITLASIAGHQGVAGLVDYCASKHGAVGFNDSVHRELIHIGSDVKTTCVNPCKSFSELLILLLVIVFRLY